MDQGFIGDLERIDFHAFFNEWPRYWQKNIWIDSREQGGFTREVITHYVQMIQRLFGDMENIFSIVEYPEDINLSERKLIAKSDIDGIPVSINGVVDKDMDESLSLKIIGSKGRIHFDNWRDLYISNDKFEMDKFDIEEVQPLVELLDNIRMAIQGDKARIVDFYEGYNAHRVIEKLLNND